MLGDFLNKNINAVYGKVSTGGLIPDGVEVGFAQVEPNHLSAQRTSQVYAQLPAAADIEVLQQGQFVKYDYANEEVNFTGPGEWMLVFNEIKLYRDGQRDCEFAMIKDNYNARVYSPYDWTTATQKKVRYYGGNFVEGAITGGEANISERTLEFENKFKYVKTADTALDAEKTYYELTDGEYVEVETPDVEDIKNYFEKTTVKFGLDKVTIPGDYYEVHYNDDPFGIEGVYKEKMMKEGTTMVPRVFKTNVGDIFTTNAILDEITPDLLGEELKIATANGFLGTEGDDTTMTWQVVKVYTMPDGQPGVKVMRIK